MVKSPLFVLFECFLSQEEGTEDGLQMEGVDTWMEGGHQVTGEPISFRQSGHVQVLGTLSWYQARPALSEDERSYMSLHDG